MQNQELLELKGSVENIIYHNDKNQYTVLELDIGNGLVTVVGAFPFVSIGEDLCIFGNWTSHATFGEQFKSEAFDRSRPATTSAMLKYLSSGAIKGIGAKTATRIVELFGDQTLEVIENEPQRLAQIRGLSVEKAKELSQELSRVQGIKELMTFLGNFGVKPEQTVLVWKQLGEDAITCIKEDPYSVCTEETAIHFDIADAIAQSMDRLPDDLGRIKAGLIYVLKHNLNNGHTCLPAQRLSQVGSKLLGVAEPLVQNVLVEMCRNSELACESIYDIDFIFSNKQYSCEVYSAERLKLMLQFAPKKQIDVESEIDILEKRLEIQYAEKQRDAIRVAFEKGMLILTGGPGTGKTTTLNAIIRLLKEKGETVLLAAPTGRAAKRMSELTGEESKTIHRLLQVDWDENDNPVFTKNERNPLECDSIVIDEMSMVDTYLFESILRALPLSCRLVLVGDSNQLPSVGAGNVLGDIMRSGVFDIVELSEIFRQSMESLIVTNAHRIVSGQMPELSERTRDFFYLPGTSYEDASDLIVSLCATRLPKSYDYSSISDIQVLCPGRRGDLGTIELNRKLRDAINPKSEEKKEVTVNGQLFRVGDKVMQTRNNYQMAWSKDDGTSGEGVFNGDLGIVSGIDTAAGSIFVKMDDREVCYDLDHAALELEAAYAVTVHKSQGNEFTAVVLPVMGTPSLLCYRNLFYTAVTRAKKLLILVGSKQVIQKMVENNNMTKRYTGLWYFLQSERDPLKL